MFTGFWLEKCDSRLTQACPERSRRVERELVRARGIVTHSAYMFETSTRRTSLLTLCGVVQFGNSVDRFVHFLPDAIDIVCIASRVCVHGPFHGSN